MRSLGGGRQFSKGFALFHAGGRPNVSFYPKEDEHAPTAETFVFKIHVVDEAAIATCHLVAALYGFDPPRPPTPSRDFFPVFRHVSLSWGGVRFQSAQLRGGWQRESV